MKLRNFGYAAVLAVTAAAFVIGSAVPSDAKAKKKKAEAAPPAPMASCFLAPSNAVCATKGGLKFTYKNACYAAKDGAKVASDKACPVKATAKGDKKKGGKKAAKKPTKKK